jgi:6-phosphogluconate dehydrogenase
MATTWDNTALNQGITRTAMNDFWSINTSGNTIPWCDGCTIPANSLQLITKDYFTNNYYYNTDVGIYLINTAKTSLQVLVKSDIGVKVDLSTTSGCMGDTYVATVYFNSTFTLAYTNAAQTTLYNGGGTLRAIYGLYAACAVRANISASGVISNLVYDGSCC